MHSRLTPPQPSHPVHTHRLPYIGPAAGMKISRRCRPTPFFPHGTGRGKRENKGVIVFPPLFHQPITPFALSGALPRTGSYAGSYAGQYHQSQKMHWIRAAIGNNSSLPRCAIQNPSMITDPQVGQSANPSCPCLPALGLSAACDDGVAPTGSDDGGSWSHRLTSGGDPLPTPYHSGDEDCKRVGEPLASLVSPDGEGPRVQIYDGAMTSGHRDAH
jgi:hypothetical protein